jgi:hypothetical protein
MPGEAAHDGGRDAGPFVEQRPDFCQIKACKDRMVHCLRAIVIAFAGQDQAFAETVARFADAEVRRTPIGAKPVEPDITAEHAVEVVRGLSFLKQDILAFIAGRHGQDSSASCSSASSPEAIKARPSTALCAPLNVKPSLVTFSLAARQEPPPVTY